MKTATYYQPESEGNRTFKVAKEYTKGNAKFADLLKTNEEDGSESLVVTACPVVDEPKEGCCTIDAEPAKAKEPAK